MHKVEVKPYGFLAMIDGFLRAEDVESFAQNFKDTVQKMKPGFSVLLDLRGMKPVAPESQALLFSLPSFAVQHGVKRSAVVLNSAILIGQIKRNASGNQPLDNVRRYIRAENNPDWEKQAVDWLVDGKEPPALQ